MAVLTSGCTSQYNGAWSFSDFNERDQKVIQQARQYHAGRTGGTNQNQQWSQQPGQAGRGLAASSHVSLDSTQPSFNNTQSNQPRFNQNRNNQVANIRPEYRDSRRGRHNPLGLYGHLPTTSTVRDSSMSNPQGVLQVTFANEGADFDPELDPTGKKMIFASTRHRENADIYLQGIGSTTVTQLTDDQPRTSCRPSARAGNMSPSRRIAQVTGIST